MTVSRVPITCPHCLVLVGESLADLFEHLVRCHWFTRREALEVIRDFLLTRAVE